jgi:hypothetical protein
LAFWGYFIKRHGIFLIIKNNYEGKLYFYDNMVEISLLKSDGTRSVHNGVTLRVPRGVFCQIISNKEMPTTLPKKYNSPE